MMQPRQLAEFECVWPLNKSKAISPPVLTGTGRMVGPRTVGDGLWLARVREAEKWGGAAQRGQIK